MAVMPRGRRQHSPVALGLMGRMRSSPVALGLTGSASVAMSKADIMYALGSFFLVVNRGPWAESAGGGGGGKGGRGAIGPSCADFERVVGPRAEDALAGSPPDEEPP